MLPRAIFVAAALTITAAASASTDQNYLRNLARKNDPTTEQLILSSNGAFVDGSETVYDDLSLAWRFLGFYTDCNVCLDNENDDGYVEDPTECLQDGQDTTVCQNHALWAAYVDIHYEGNGVFEYQHYDRFTRKWDKSACSNEEKGRRCVRMDCHDPSSKNFKLVGVYKDTNINGFLETLSTYSGDCVWNDDEYSFMQAMESNNNNGSDDEGGNAQWPPASSCKAYQSQYDGSVVGYYKAVPVPRGNLELERFTDSSCTIPYDNKSTLFGPSSSDIASWNSAMDALKICQPCVSYPTMSDLDHYNAKGDRYDNNDNEQNYDDDANQQQQDGPFVCQQNLQQDDPINQCQVLVQEGQDSMKLASYRDILLAESQGTVSGINLSPIDGSRKQGKFIIGESFAKPKNQWRSILLFVVSVGYFGFALSQLFNRDRSKHGSKTLQQPLVEGKTTNGNSNSNRSRSSSRNRSSNIKSSAKATAAPASRKKSKEGKKNEKVVNKEKKVPKSILKNSEPMAANHDGGSNGDDSHYSRL